MMFSGFTLITALVTAWCLYRALKIILHHPCWSARIRPAFLHTLILLFFLRLAMPFNFIISLPVALPPFIVRLEACMDSTMFLGITGYGLLSYVQLIGMGAALWRFYLQQRHMGSLHAVISSEAEHFKVSDFMENYRGPDYPVLISSLVHSPFSLGRSYEIVLGKEEYSKEELEMILCHELQHLASEDASYIRLCRYLQIFYWYVPFIYSFMDCLNEFFELRVDESVTRYFDDDKKLRYCQSLIHVCKKALYPLKGDRIEAPLPYADHDGESLSCRINYLIFCLHPRPTAFRYYLLLLVLTGLSWFILPVS